MPHTPDPDGVLFEGLRRRLTAISRRIVGSEAEAEDIVQDCFLTWHQAERRALLTPAAWLTTVVQRRSIDLLRKRAREGVAAHLAQELAPDQAPAPPEHALLRRAELGEALACLLARLSPSERLALVLHKAFDCEHADIAALLGTTPANARQHLARARRRLRAENDEPPMDETLSRELVRRFQTEINGADVPMVAALLAGEQPVSVHASSRSPIRMGACANDASYGFALAA